MTYTIFGWAVLFIIGLLLVKGSIAMMLFSKGFTGRWIGRGSDSIPIIAMFLGGLAILTLALMDIPFTVSLK